MKKVIPLFFALVVVIATSCNKVETIITGTTLEFETETAIADVSIDVYEITDIEFNSSGTTSNRKLVETISSNSEGVFNYTTDSRFEELEFDFRKEKYVDEFSSDNFKIQPGDNSNLNVTMYREGVIRFVIVDDPGINNQILKLIVQLFSDGNIQHEFTGGNASLLKQVRGNTETIVTIERDNGFTSTNSIFVEARDTLDFEIKY